MRLGDYFRAAPETFAIGDILLHPDFPGEHLLAQVESGKVCLIDIEQGNRWKEPCRVNNTTAITWAEDMRFILPGTDTTSCRWSVKGRENGECIALHPIHVGSRVRGGHYIAEYPAGSIFHGNVDDYLLVKADIGNVVTAVSLKNGNFWRVGYPVGDLSRITADELAAILGSNWADWEVI